MTTTTAPDLPEPLFTPDMLAALRWPDRSPSPPGAATAPPPPTDPAQVVKLGESNEPGGIDTVPEVPRA